MRKMMFMAWLFSFMLFFIGHFSAYSDEVPFDDCSVVPASSDGQQVYTAAVPSDADVFVLHSPNAADCLQAEAVLWEQSDIFRPMFPGRPGVFAIEWPELEFY